MNMGTDRIVRIQDLHTKLGALPSGHRIPPLPANPTPVRSLPSVTALSIDPQPTSTDDLESQVRELCIAGTRLGLHDAVAHLKENLNILRA